MARTTVYDYLAALQRLMLVEDVPAWAPHMRSKAALRKEPKRHFVDPSLAVAALSATPERLLADLNYGDSCSSRWQCATSVSCQARYVARSPTIATAMASKPTSSCRPDGTWGAFEVKLGPERVDEAAASLHRFMSMIDTSKSGQPAVLGVITTATVWLQATGRDLGHPLSARCAP